MSKKWKDIAERMVWTLVAAAAGFGLAHAADIPPAYGLVFTTALTGIKGYAATHVGNKESASMTSNI